MKLRLLKMNNTDYANTDKITLSDDIYKIIKSFCIKVDCTNIGTIFNLDI